MKKLLSLSVVCALMILSFSACKKNSNGNGNGSSTDTLFVSLSSNTVELNEYDYVAVTVRDKNGADITSNCFLYAGGNVAIGTKYVPISLGAVNITAARGNAPCKPAVLTVVPKTPSPYSQKAVVEDVTGAWCGFCPRVAYSLSNYKATHPNLIPLAMHGGGSDPIKFQYYASFNSQFLLSGYPSAVLNRKSEWGESLSELDNALAKWSPLGIGISSTVNGTSVSGNVKIKFNVNTDKSLKLVIMLVEDGLLTSQTNYYSNSYSYTPKLYGGVNPIPNFVNNGVIRKTATNLFGDPIPANTQTKNNEYVVPFTLSLTGQTSDGTSFTSVAANSSIVAMVVDASGNIGTLNVQQAALGATQNYD